MDGGDSPALYRTPGEGGEDEQGVDRIARYFVIGHWSEVRDQRSEVRDQRSETGDQRSEVIGQRSETRDRRSEIRDQRPEIRGQRLKLEVFYS